MVNKRTVVAVLVGAIALTTSSCGSPASSSASHHVAGTASSPTTNTTSIGQVSTTTVATAESGGETTTLLTVDAGNIVDCVDLVQFGVSTGNELLAALWDQAGHSLVSLRTNCEALGRTDPETLAAMSSQWQDIKTWRAAVEEAASTTQAPAPQPTSPPHTNPAATKPTSGCSGGYVNVDGNCVPRPVAAPSAPPGTTAHCRDGTYSFSQHRQGTCSHHGGVAVWL